MNDNLNVNNCISTFELAETQMKQFSLYDCERSLPNVIDGFKTTQRKIIFTLLDMPRMPAEHKVSQLAGFVAAKTDYHHGDASIVGVISKMAQDFVGTNNVNWLLPLGQFGNIMEPMPSAGRYIFTNFSDDFRKYYKQDDDIILTKQYSDTLEIEPENYIPLIPTILINGTAGIGTGFASEFMNHNPKEIINWILAELDKPGGKRKRIKPWYKDFKGDVVIGEKDNQWIFSGLYERINPKTLIITEIPIGVSIESTKEVLNNLVDSGFIKKVANRTTLKDGIRFEITLNRESQSKLDEMTPDEILTTFGLISKGTMNLTAWMPGGKKLKKFSTVESLIRYFITYRLDCYAKRKVLQVDDLTAKLAVMNEKIKFIRYYISNSAKISKMKKAELEEFLSNEGYVHIQDLISIRIYNLTQDQIEKMESDIRTIESKIEYLKNVSNEDLYRTELKNLLASI